MAGARNHYEVVFSSLLTISGGDALCVDEARRPRFDARELKNFDYLVNGPRQVWAVDLKGRRGTPWVTRTDLFSMLSWLRHFAAARANDTQTGFVFSFFTPAGIKTGRGIAE